VKTLNILVGRLNHGGNVTTQGSRRPRARPAKFTRPTIPSPLQVP
jgi:hypothetical protein